MFITEDEEGGLKTIREKQYFTNSHLPATYRTHLNLNSIVYNSLGKYVRIRNLAQLADSIHGARPPFFLVRAISYRRNKCVCQRCYSVRVVRTLKSSLKLRAHLCQAAG